MRQLQGKRLIHTCICLFVDDASGSAISLAKQGCACSKTMRHYQLCNTHTPVCASVIPLTAPVWSVTTPVQAIAAPPTVVSPLSGTVWAATAALPFRCSPVLGSVAVLATSRVLNIRAGQSALQHDPNQQLHGEVTVQHSSNVMKITLLCDQECISAMIVTMCTGSMSV